MALKETSRLSHYRLVREIGEGGMGTVWSAVDEKLGRQVALKFISERLAGDPQQLLRLQDEARAIAALNHPNIVTIYEIDESEGTCFLAMEMIEGSPLSEIIPGGGFPLETLLEFAIALVDAVSAAHDRGLAHGDLKPRNIMVTDQDRLKVLDFGLARSLPSPCAAGDLSSLSTLPLEHPRQLSGTLPYMSPERLRGMPADRSSDIFALGVILHEMAIGARPHPGDTPSDLIASILKDTPPLVSDLRPTVPRSFALIVRRCLLKDPVRRMRSAHDLRDELEEVRRETGAGGPATAASVAVLPFLDMSAEKDQEYFCEGIAEEIINALTRVAGLRVASRTSSFRFRQAAISSDEIGRELHVATLLEGSVRKAGRRLRIAVRLTGAEGGFQIWSESYDRDLEDVFAIQEEIARSIVAALQLTLSPKEYSSLGAPQTTDVQAYDAYLRGRKFYYQYRRRGCEFGLQMFSRAIEIDPDYASAYAGIADCCTFLYLHVAREPAYRDRALEASRRALELAPGSALVHASRGAALSMGGEHDGARAEFETAIRLDPSLFEAHYFYARESFVQGDLEKAARLYEEASRVRPEDYQAPLLVCQVYDVQGMRDQARRSRLRGVRLAERHLRLHPDDTRALYFAANAMVALGDIDRGLEWTRRAVEMEPDDSMLLYNVGCIQSLAGRIEDAIDSLERAARQGLRVEAWYRMDSNLDPLRGHPRFEALLASLASDPS